MKTHATTHNSAGFTIVELMIATVVFSMVLLAITAGVLSFTNSYYKGINTSNTQAAARTVLQDITQAIQFSGQDIIPPVDGHFCAGGKVYMYSLGKQLTGAVGSGNWGLYEATPPNSGCSALDGPRSGGTELLGPRMRLAQIDIVQSGNLYTVSITVAYGDNDLLCTPSVGGSCTSNTILTDAQLSDGKITCKAQTGSQFCAVSGLSTAVVQRVE